VNAKRLQFAQQKQSENMVEIGVGECDARDGRLTHALPRMQLGGGFDLRAQVGRRAQQEPRAGILVRATEFAWRGLPRNVPTLTAPAIVQAQFHCGNAPPAAEPSIFTCISREFTA